MTSPPKSAAAFYDLALVWQSRGKTALALAGYKKAIRLDPRFVPAHLELGQLLLRLGKRGEAAAVYRNAAKLNPGELCFSQKLAALLGKTVSKSEKRRLQWAGSRAASDRGRTWDKRLVLYTDCSGIYGAGRFNHLILAGLAERGFSVAGAMPVTFDGLTAERERLGIRHIAIEEDDLYDPAGRHRSLTDSAEPGRIFASLRPDLIVFSDGFPFSNLAAKKAAEEMRIPYLAIVHFVPPSPGVRFEAFLPDLRLAYGNAAAVVAVSGHGLRLLRREFGLSGDRDRTILPGIPDRFFSPPEPGARRKLRDRLGIPRDGLISLTAARLELGKGYQHQLKAMRLLRREIQGERLWWVWAGSGTLEPRLRAEAMRLDLLGRIRFVGEQEDMIGYLDGADFFVLPTEGEGMPLAVMEAMARALPVAVSAVGGVPEEMGKTGKLLPDPTLSPDGTVRELVDILTAWSLDRKRRLVAGREGKKRAARLFRSSRMLEEVVEVIDSCPAPEKKRKGRPRAIAVDRRRGGMVRH